MSSDTTPVVRKLLRVFAVVFSISIATALIVHEHRKAQSVVKSGTDTAVEQSQASSAQPSADLTEASDLGATVPEGEPVNEPQVQFLLSSKSGLPSGLLPPLPEVVTTTPMLYSSKSLSFDSSLSVFPDPFGAPDPFQIMEELPEILEPMEEIPKR